MSRFGWHAVRRWLSANRLDAKTFRSEAVAGLPGAVGSVPDGMAASVLAGVNPVYGLYASFAGPITGGVLSSTRVMVVTTTSAAALAAGGALAGLPPDQRPGALFLLTVLAGIVMVVAGLLRLGRYTRFVSHSVMTGFLTGIAINIVLGQLSDLTGAPGGSGPAIAKAWTVVTHPDKMSLVTVLVGMGAIGIMLVVAHTPVRSYAALVALIAPTAVIEILGVSGVKRVSDVGKIPSGLPVPQLPGLGSFSLNLVVSALAIAAIVLVQGAGVSESAPNTDGRSDLNRDFLAQGAANIAAGIFKGQPVGGSVGQTALNVSSGARTRWAGVFSGIWMLAILVAFSGLVGVVAIATLAGILIVAAVSSIRLLEVHTILRAGTNAAIGFAATLIATLLLPIAAAVGVGVALSLLLQLNSELVDLRLIELVRRPDGRLEERPLPERFADRTVTIIDINGSLRFAGARTLQAHLPDPAGTDTPVVVLRLRGQPSLGATFVVVVADYADRLGHAGGHLFLAGVPRGLLHRLDHTQRLEAGHNTDVYEMTSVLGASTIEAATAADRWLANRTGSSDEGG